MKLESGEKFSVVIPTLWKSFWIYRMIREYAQCEQVAEIILINNDPDGRCPVLPIYSKLKIIDVGRNIYVNPAWNLGASLAKHTVILANDDLFIEHLDELLHEISQTNFDLIGATINDLTPIRKGVHPYAGKKFPRKSFGCFMVCRNYQPIPEQLLIYSGDKYLFYQSRNVGLIGSNYIKTPVSTTMNSDPKFLEIGKADVKRFNQLNLVPQNEN